MSEFEEQVAEDRLCVDDLEQDEVDKAIEEAGLTSADLADMAELEKDMENADVAGSVESLQESSSNQRVASTDTSGPSAKATKFMPAGAMPTTSSGGLSSLANEFWFPESRNCACCKGYKHGCKCRVGNIQVCQDPKCTTNVSSSESTEYKIEPPRPRKKKEIIFKSDKIAAGVAQSTTASAPAPAPAPGPAPAPTPIDTTPTVAPTMASPSAPMCTFFNTPQGCRYGASCRFSHDSQTQGSPGARTPQMSPTSMQPCVYFRQGNCRNGPACSFAHI